MSVVSRVVVGYLDCKQTYIHGQSILTFNPLDNILKDEARACTLSKSPPVRMINLSYV